ncbi:MAG: 3-deoxy-7-phosphoheptulonate synthase [Nitriliruptoraceae bacterium]|nr:3-deoxy-7-phosphoheptulonate synthase [Nitriliruptoraceae bacterium]
MTSIDPSPALVAQHRHVTSFDALPRPSEIREELPVDEPRFATVARAREEVAAALRGADDRMVVVVGPCSIHDPGLALEYARLLREQADAHRDELIVVMRTYFEKPRTSIGWKGLIYDPSLDGTSDALRGLRTARQVLLDVLGLGLPCAVEVLDAITPQYYADLVSWAAIGARTVESQVHRQLASGLSMPIGFKNATDGRVGVAVNALAASIEPHAFFGVDDEGRSAVVRTSGNPDAHLVLRGGDDGPNFARAHVEDAAQRAQPVTGHQRPVMVDASHGNSGKDHRRQRVVVEDLLEQWGRADHGLLGVMLESNLQPGRQDWHPNQPLEYGVSITDACVGWDETVELLGRCAAAVTATR